MVNLACLNCLCIRCKNLNEDGSCSAGKYTSCKNNCDRRIYFRPLAENCCLSFDELIPKWRVEVNK